MTKLRCAIYTRKSSEEGLEQPFNSLDAQREACEAYIVSQKGEGWTALRTAYDDGGWSGGSMERPALRQLLADVEANRIDIIVVYKVDRLTRSLADFARMVDLFDRHKVSFVSVTQAFNTTSSMGRLTLNVLLSFAQFEREVTGERIRDKIAASKAKGMWMGGYPPLGFDPKDRTLVVNEAEAATVCHIFSRYLELGSVNLLVQELKIGGIVSKHRTSSSGVSRGGVPLTRGAVFYMLRNRIYRGEIVHKDKAFPGQHPAIIDADLFDAVQTSLKDNGVSRRERTTARAPLTGLIFDAAGDRMSPTHARGRSGTRYLYYVSTPLQTGGQAPENVLRRVPARLMEDALLGRLRHWSGRTTDNLADLVGRVRRLEVHRDAIIVDVSPPAHENWAGNIASSETASTPMHDLLRIVSPMKLRLRGSKTWLIESSVAPRRPRPDRALIAGLRRAHAELAKRGIDMTDARTSISEARGMGDPYLRKLSSLAFLAPDIQRDIVTGAQPVGLTLSIILATPLPLDWHEQRKLLGFAGQGRT